MIQITDKQDQIKYLQKIEWFDDKNHMDFTEISDFEGKFIFAITERGPNRNVNNGKYGISDNAVVLTVKDKEYILYKMLISEENHLEGKIIIVLRHDPFIELPFNGIQKK